MLFLLVGSCARVDIGEKAYWKETVMKSGRLIDLDKHNYILEDSLGHRTVVPKKKIVYVEN